MLIWISWKDLKAFKQFESFRTIWKLPKRLNSYYIFACMVFLTKYQLYSYVASAIFWSTNNLKSTDKCINLLVWAWVRVKKMHSRKQSWKTCALITIQIHMHIGQTIVSWWQLQPIVLFVCKFYASLKWIRKHVWSFQGEQQKSEMYLNKNKINDNSKSIGNTYE